MRLLLLLPLSWVACNETEFSRATATDDFQQAPSDQVDILWVIDNSVSMQNEQESVALGAEDFIANLEATNMDFHLGVITTDVDRSNPTAGVLLGTPPVLTKDTATYADAFRSRVAQGTRGSDQESGLEAAVMTISAPLADGPNDGFLRVGAMLSIIILSDENDCSDNGSLGAESSGEDCYTRVSELTPVTDLVRQLADVKAGDQVVLSGIVGPDIADACTASVPGRRYFTAIELLGGQQANICETDYSEIMNALGQVATGMLSIFQLSHAATEESIKVTLTPAGGEAYEVPMSAENGWTYIAAYAQIEFHGDQIPPREAAIEVKYEIAGQVETEAPADSGATTP